MSSHPSHHVLFLCTGNYYRSRFAELLFNHLASQAGLGWQADSRGLDIALGASLPGDISPYALEALAARRVPVEQPLRPRRQVQPEDFAAAVLVIALQDEEHRPYLERDFPVWAARVEYWHVPDLRDLSAGEALGLIEQGVRDLVQRLAGRQPGEQTFLDDSL